MRILFLAKRFYMHHDAPVDRYGRLYYLPYELSRVPGNSVLAISIAYREAEDLDQPEVQDLDWRSMTLSPTKLGSSFTLFRRLKAITQQYSPDVIIASSDLFCVISGHWLARKLGIKFIADLYDNYESFGMVRIPGFRSLYREAITDADAVTCVSEPLTRHIKDRYLQSSPVVTVETTIDTDLFKPGDMDAARQKLGLPLDSVLVGIAGSLGAAHGVSTLYKAFEQLRPKRIDLHLVLAGMSEKSVPLPKGERVHYLGTIPNEDVAIFYQAMDITVICIRDTAFGRYSFPQKTYEILGCRRPVIATDIGALHMLFRNYPSCLYAENDIEDLAKKITAMIHYPVIPSINVPSWDHQALKVDSLIKSVN